MPTSWCSTPRTSRTMRRSKSPSSSRRAWTTCSSTASRCAGTASTPARSREGSSAGRGGRVGPAEGRANESPPLAFEGRGDSEAGGGVFLSVDRARELRRTLTPPERRLWNVLKQRPDGFKFRKQHEHGPFYLDFFCYEAVVAVEVDGLAHELG